MLDVLNFWPSLIGKVYLTKALFCQAACAKGTNYYKLQGDRMYLLERELLHNPAAKILEERNAS